ncbi:MAG: TIGR02302 family protein [Telmatospirillum sp.]|nr:TIGR02302 family protein [Telmatospirillum sp.]
MAIRRPGRPDGRNGIGTDVPVSGHGRAPGPAPVRGARPHALIVARARLILTLETAWPRLLPLLALILVFAAIALSDLLPRLPGWLHAGILALFAAGTAGLCARLAVLRWPDRAAAARRVEHDSGLTHRPLQVLEDRLAAGTGDPATRALWTEQLRRVAGGIGPLSVRPPAIGFPWRDPFRIRFLPVVLLGIALAAGWQDAPDRLARALLPHLPGGTDGPVLQVWITPPAYTGAPPLLLPSEPDGHPLTVPAGTTLLAVIQGGRAPARLIRDRQSQPFERLDVGSQRLETALTRSGPLSIRLGRRRLALWDVALEDPTPPAIAFAGVPESDADGRLRFEIISRDDYGISKTEAVIRRTGSPEEEPLVIDLPASGPHPGEARQSAWIDLTGHLWAGMTVTIEPVATNLAGLKTAGPAIQMVLPEREFHHPVARAVIVERHRLIADSSSREGVARNLAAIASQPAAYGNNLTAFLALATSISRLSRDQSDNAVPSVVDMLWQTALGIEDGDRPAARRAVDEAAEALERALAEGASQAEIEQLTNQLRQAMERYLDALARQAMERGVPPIPVDPDRNGITAEDLDGMLNQMRELSRTGSTEAARRLLGDMRQLLDGLRVGPSGSDATARKAGKALQDLDDIAKDQRQLLDETFRRSQRAQPPVPQLPPPGPGGEGRQGEGRDAKPGDAATVQRQDALRRRLDAVMKSLGDLDMDVPRSLGQSGQAMGDATRQLRNGDLDDAVDAQTEALTRLQEGARAATETLSRRMGPGVVGRGPMNGRDPLGRPMPGGSDPDDDHSVKIPAQADQQKARDVLMELRRRAGQADRPDVERGYLQRLLKQFF